MIRPPRADRVSLHVPQSASTPTQGEATNLKAKVGNILPPIPQSD
jgi:hypothetical protein